MTGNLRYQINAADIATTMPQAPQKPTMAVVYVVSDIPIDPPVRGCGCTDRRDRGCTNRRMYEKRGVGQGTPLPAGSHTHQLRVLGACKHV